MVFYILSYCLGCKTCCLIFNMRYKIIVTFPELKTAEKIYELLRKFKVYNSQELMSLNPIKEVCEECNNKK